MGRREDEALLQRGKREWLEIEMWLLHHRPYQQTWVMCHQEMREHKAFSPSIIHRGGVFGADVAGVAGIRRRGTGDSVKATVLASRRHRSHWSRLIAPSVRQGITLQQV